MSEVIVVQHEPFETAGTIEDSLKAIGITVRYVRPFSGERVPNELRGARGLIVLGGTMGVYEQDRFPFLTDEIRLIEQALKLDLPVLGICLGSQLLASALGAEVYKSGWKEIGWLPVSFTAAASADPLCCEITSPLSAFHWHGDIFDLPNGAELLASSALTERQAYRYGEKVYAFLFHPEVTAPIINGMVEAGAEELKEEGLDASRIRKETEEHLPAFQKTAAVIWNRWAALVAEETTTFKTTSI